MSFTFCDLGRGQKGGLDEDGLCNRLRWHLVSMGESSYFIFQVSSYHVEYFNPDFDLFCLSKKLEVKSISNNLFRFLIII